MRLQRCRTLAFRGEARQPPQAALVAAGPMMRQAKAACQLKRQMPRGARLTVKGAGAEREGWCRLMLYVEDAAMWPTVVHHA